MKKVKILFVSRTVLQLNHDRYNPFFRATLLFHIHLISLKGRQYLIDQFNLGFKPSFPTHINPPTLHWSLDSQASICKKFEVSGFQSLSIFNFGYNLP
jgi:hypothetical protein